METTEATKEATTMDTNTEFKGKWDFNFECDCPKCENYSNMLADCIGDARSMEEGGASPDRPVKGWRLHHTPEVK